MSSPAAMITLASDVLVLGAAVSVARVGLKSFGVSYKDKLSTPVNATLGGSDSCAEEDDLM
ncbi:hypothetical protein ABVK25_005720 [Lepraria finkii]|uniref:Uncharacterized protein n=1 Tax=Lepraria finkii TaxID=1340010 RepID=A0ABR4BBH2_9LECA